MPNVVEILVTAKNLAKPAMDSATADARGLGGVMGKMATVSTVALAGVAAESIKMAGDFQSSTTRLITSAGETDKNIDMVRKGMLNMAGQVGMSANDLAKGMYTVESAGYHGADGLKVLKAAAQGAKDENADLGTVANAVTDALVDYHLKAGDSANITSQLVAAVSQGKTTFEEFSGSMSTVLPLSSALHIKLSDVTGVMATMTAHGVSAAQASQNIANAMRHLAAPTGTMKKEFEALGITSKDVTTHLSKQGLAGTMEFLSQTAEKAGKIGTPAYTEALSKLMGSASGLNVALQTTGENSAKTQKAIKAIGKASSDSKGDVEGFSKVQQTMKQRVAELNASFQSLMIELGNKLIPVISSLVNWMNKHQKIVIGVVVAIGGLMAALVTYSVVMKTVEVATKLWAAAQWLLDAAMDANPIGIVIIAIAALVAGLILAYKHSTAFRNAVNAVGKAAKTAFNAVVKWAEIAFNWIKDHWKLVLSILTGPIGAAVIFIVSHWKKISSTASSVIDDVKSIWGHLIHILESPFSTAWSYISSIFGKITSYISSLPGKVASAAKHAGSSLLSSLNPFAHGGTIGAAATGGGRSGLTLVGEAGPELVHLPTGSHVFSNPDTRGMLGGGCGAATVILEFQSGNGTAFENAIMDIVRKGVRVKGGNVQVALGRNR